MMETNSNENPNEENKVKFSNYNKKTFLKTIKNTKCRTKCEKELARIGRQPHKTQLIKDYINKQAETCQERVSRVMEMESNAAFVNLNDWAHMFSQPSNEDHNYNGLGIPIITELISNTEKFPSPNEVCGIDLSKLYTTVANLMAGLPTEELDAPSKSFLFECYKELFDELTIDDVSDLQTAVDVKPKMGTESSIDSRHTKHLTEILQDSEINPLNLPVALQD